MCPAARGAPTRPTRLNMLTMFKQAPALAKLEGETAELSIPATSKEWGECPTEHPGERTDSAILYEYIKAGLSNAEIMT